MKIIDTIVHIEQMTNGPALVCRITMADGSQLETVAPWRNTLGLWASDSDQREPAEIAAHLRCFAAAIEKAAEQAKAA